MLTGYPLSCTLGRSVLEIGSGVARFLMTAEYATYRYLRCVVNVIQNKSFIPYSGNSNLRQKLDITFFRHHKSSGKFTLAKKPEKAMGALHLCHAGIISSAVT